jgi:AraC-like DNA-binding protein
MSDSLPSGPWVDTPDQNAGSSTLLMAKIHRYMHGKREQDTPFAGLSFALLRAPTAPVAYLYPPSLSLIISGKKQVRVGDEEYVYDRTRFLLTAVNLPIVTEVLEASDHVPYIALRMALDVPAVRDFVSDPHFHGTVGRCGRALAMGEVSTGMLAAVERLVDIVDDAHALRHLGPLIQREMMYYILTSAAGTRLREIAVPDSGNYRAAKAIRWIQEHYVRPLRVDDLAARVGLGVSTLHKHFRDMTAMSPLNYQKQLRLLEAQRLLVTERMEASAAALRVGYESASQFNRDYKRMFGDPPIRSALAFRARLSEKYDPLP